MLKRKTPFGSVTLCAVAAIVFMFMGMPAQAAVTVSVDVPSYIAGPGFDFLPYDHNVNPTTNERTVHTTRLISQTFRTTQTITLTEVSALFVRGFSGQITRMRIYGIADTLASPITTETLLLDVQFNMPAGLDSGSNDPQVLKIGLTGPESITLPATTDPAGYALMFNTPDGTGNAFTWRARQQGTTGNAGSVYVGGQWYHDALAVGSTTRDALFGLKGVPPPNAVKDWVLHH